MKVVAFPTTPGWQRIARMLGPSVLAAFKRGGRWWVIVDGEPPVEITVEQFLDREASREDAAAAGRGPA